MTEPHESVNRSMTASDDANPRWHLINLVPIWILQCIITFIMGVLPSICIFSCSLPTTYVASLINPLALMLGSNRTIPRAERLASNFMLISMLATATEVYMFAFKRLTPVRNILFQGTKSTLSVGQIFALVVHDFRYSSGESWAPIMKMVSILSPIW
jgi:hypothetical protein